MAVKSGIQFRLLLGDPQRTLEGRGNCCGEKVKKHLEDLPLFTDDLSSVCPIIMRLCGRGWLGILRWKSIVVLKTATMTTWTTTRRTTLWSHSRRRSRVAVQVGPINSVIVAGLPFRPPPLVVGAICSVCSIPIVCPSYYPTQQQQHQQPLMDGMQQQRDQLMKSMTKTDGRCTCNGTLNPDFGSPARSLPSHVSVW